MARGALTVGALAVGAIARAGIAGCRGHFFVRRSRVRRRSDVPFRQRTRGKIIIEYADADSYYCVPYEK